MRHKFLVKIDRILKNFYQWHTCERCIKFFLHDDSIWKWSAFILFLNFYQKFDQIYLCNYLIKFNKIFFYLTCIGLYNLNKKIFIKFDQVVVEISLFKYLVKIWAQLLFDRRFLKILQDFDQRYLCNHLTKFYKIFFIWIVYIYTIQTKKILSNLIKWLQKYF